MSTRPTSIGGSLVIVTDFEAEAKRILAGTSAFDVLLVDPMTVTPDLVRARYNDIKRALITRESIGNTLVARAKGVLDGAFASLSDTALIARARDAHAKVMTARREEAEVLESIRTTTLLLESRAAALRVARDTRGDESSDLPLVVPSTDDTPQ